jgi:hypothetical protein
MGEAVNAPTDPPPGLIAHRDAEALNPTDTTSAEVIPDAPAGHPALAVVAPRSRGRGLDPQPRGSLLQHGGEPLGRFGPFCAEVLGLGLEPPDLLAQRLTVLLESLAFGLGGLRHHLEQAALAQKLANPLKGL